MDTIFFSYLLAFVLIVIAWRVGRKITSGVPAGFANATEAVVEFVDQQVKDVFPKPSPLIGPLALTIFAWVFLMNIMDLIPVDLLPEMAKLIGIEYLKVVPTTDLSTTFALSLSVFGLVIFYNLKVKGVVGYLKGFLFHPFGKFFVPVNIVMTAIEEVAKPLSLALRLFGNLFAGELVFLLIALIGGMSVVLNSDVSILNALGAMVWLALQVLLDLGWLIFHLLVVTLQAFIFMVLTIVYLGMAHQEDH